MVSGFGFVNVGGSSGGGGWEIALFLLLLTGGLRFETGENCWRGRGLRPSPA